MDTEATHTLNVELQQETACVFIPSRESVFFRWGAWWTFARNLFARRTESDADKQKSWSHPRSNSDPSTMNESIKLSVLLLLALVLLVLVAMLTEVGAMSKGNPHPQLLKAQHAKMKTMTINRGVRERENGLNKAYRLNTREKEEKRDALEKLEDSVVELYVRRVETGPWSFFQYLSDASGSKKDEPLYQEELRTARSETAREGEEVEEEVSTAPMSLAIANGGIEAEQARADLDRWVAGRCHMSLS
jgi:hypothetical protein